MNLKNADLTNPVQKVIAGAVGVGVLGVLYFALPPLVFILKNIWLTVGLAAPILFLGYNYEICWTLLKQVSWNMTKKMISTDKLWHMWQGYHYLVGKNEALEQNIVTVGAIRSKTEKELAKIADAATKAKNEALFEEKRDSKDPESVKSLKLKMIRNKVALYDNQFKTIQPRLQYIQNQHSQLIELHQNWVADANMLKQTLEVKSQEYELMKELSKASDNASAFLKDSPEMQNFQESLKQIEASIDQYTSNVENFQRTILPTLNKMDTQREMSEEEGRKLIEQYKTERLQLQ